MLNKTPSAIFTGDIHLRENTPKCRTDNYFEAQAKKIQWLKELQERYNGIPVIDSGDSIHREEDASRRRPPSPWLLTFCIKNLPDMITVPGNHDTPSRNIKLLEKAAITTLEAAKKMVLLTDPDDPYIYDDGKIIMIYGFPWGVKPKPVKPERGIRKIAVCHYLVYEEKNAWEDLESEKGSSFLNKMKGYDIVLTGHNHLPFTAKSGRRLLVNPGSMMRSHADQIDHKPRVYLWYAEDNSIEPVYFPIDEGVIDRSHIDKVKEKDSRLEAVIQRLNDDYEVEVSFERNLEAHFKSNRTKSAVEEMIWEGHNG